MKTLTRSILLAAIFALASQSYAKPSATLPVGSHYPIGAEGIKGADLPPPGFYLRDYNYFYYADKVDGLPMDMNVLVYCQAPKLVWMTPWSFCGVNYGMDMIIPFVYKDVNAPFGDGSQFNLGDIYFSPLVLSKHFKQFDVAGAYGIYAPSGNFDNSTPLKSLTSPGNGYWSHMFTLGAVWYPDEKKAWAVSLLNRYEINTEQDQTHITPGNMLSMEWAVSKTVAQGVDVGLAGSYQQEVTKDSGAGAATALSHEVGVGPEVSVLWEKIGLFSSLRYLYEVDAKDRPQGHIIELTLTKRF
jgi:hypothetical protein